MSAPKRGKGQAVTQKFLAEYLRLSPSTVSLVMNGALLSGAITEETKKRIFEAAEKFDYRPDFHARYLATKRSYTVAVLLPEVSEVFSAPIVSGIDKHLVPQKYFYYLANHHGKQELIDEFPRALLQRAVEGFILVNTPLMAPLGVPTVSIGRQAQAEGIARIALDNHRGGWLALEHLAGQGHRRIAVLKGHSWRSASHERWEGISNAAAHFGISISPKLVMQLPSSSRNHGPSVPEEGYESVRKLLAKGLSFSALIAFNDVTAIGAIRAFHDAGIGVPQDISVIGFDDIQAAAYQIPRLTTLRQPLKEMGELAASTLLKQITGKLTSPRDTLVEPELVIRESTRSIAT